MAGHQVQLDWSLFGKTCIINLNNIGNCQIPGVLLFSVPGEWGT